MHAAKPAWSSSKNELNAHTFAGPCRAYDLMALTINHLSIRTLDMESTRRFYVDLLGLSVGPRPAFPFPGMWLYRGDHADVANAVVHVIGMDPNDPDGLKQYLGDRDVSALTGSGAIDHIAFFADGLSDMLAHLKIPIYLLLLYQVTDWQNSLKYYQEQFLYIVEIHQLQELLFLMLNHGQLGFFQTASHLFYI